MVLVYRFDQLTPQRHGAVNEIQERMSLPTIRLDMRLTRGNTRRFYQDFMEVVSPRDAIVFKTSRVLS